MYILRTKKRQLQLFCFFSSKAGQNFTYYQDSNTQCPLELKQTLPGINCTSHDCKEITCSARFRNQETYLSLATNQWGGTVNAYFTMSVPKRHYHWSAFLQDGEGKKIPGFPPKISGSVDADVFFLQFSRKKTNGTIDLKV